MTKPIAETTKDVWQYIDRSKVVRVYRNLRTGLLSVQQSGIVVCHVRNIVLRDVKFQVGKKGRERVRQEKRKNVHAFITGTVIDPGEAWKNRLYFAWTEVCYNPYKVDHWMDEDREVDRAKYADIDAHGKPLAFDIRYR